MQIQASRGPLDISDFPTRHPYGLALWQTDIERILAGWVDELGVAILRDREVVGLAQDDDGVDVELSDGTRCARAYLVGCDGGRSVVRKAAGIDFPGWDATTSWMIAEVEMDEEPEIGVRREGGGIGPVDRANGGGPYGVVLKEREVEHDAEPDLRGPPRRRSSPRTGPTSACTARRGCRGSPTRPGRPRPTAPAGAARRRRRARAPAAGRPGPQHRRAGRGEPRLEARAGGRGRLTRAPARHLPRRTPSGRARGCCRNTMAQSRSPPPTTARRAARDRGRAAGAWTSRAGTSPGGCPGSTSTTTSATATRWSAGACRTSTCETADGPTRVFDAAARRPAGAPRLRRRRRLRPHAVGDRVRRGRAPPTTARGSSRARRGRRARGRAGPARRLRRLGGRPRRPRAAGRGDHVVRAMTRGTHPLTFCVPIRPVSGVIRAQTRPGCLRCTDHARLGPDRYTENAGSRSAAYRVGRTIGMRSHPRTVEVGAASCRRSRHPTRGSGSAARRARPGPPAGRGWRPGRSAGRSRRSGAGCRAVDVEDVGVG